MADHAVEVELYYDGQWNAAPAYVRDGIALSRGAAGEGQDAPPSTATLTLDDRSPGQYNPQDVNGPLYGLIGRNTPMRVSADGSVRSTTEVASWAADRSTGGASLDRWSAVQGGGILRRLQQGKTPLRAPFYRAILADGPAVFWPLDELEGSTQWSSGVGGDPVALVGALEFGALTGSPGAAGLAFADLAGSTGYGVVRMPALTPAAWGFEYLVYLRAVDESIDGGASLVSWDASGDVGRDGWSINVHYDVDPGGGGDGYGLTVVGNFYQDSLGFSLGQYGIDPGWHHVRVQATQVGANVEVQMWIDGVDNLGPIVPESTPGILGVPGPLTFVADSGSDPVTNMAAGIGMLAFYNGTVPDHSAAATGYAGELAGERFLRVLAEEGVPAVVIGDETDTQPMGPQPSATLVAIARECVRTDDGLMFEPVDDRALVMRTGRSLRNQAPAWTIDFTAGVVAPGFRPVTDDANTRNDVTATRGTGAAARATRETGPLNVQDPIDDPEGVGRYDVQIDVNPATDEALLSHATWHLAKGTNPAPRYPTITIDLDAAPGVIAAVDALEIGDRVDVENLPTEWQIGNASLILLGVKERYPAGAGRFRRLVTLNAGPAAPYEVLLVGNTAGSVDLRGMRAGTELSTVDGAHPSNDTTILIDSAGITWTTSADDLDPAKNGGGLYLTIAGEVVRVTSIAGAGSAWTLTVLRGQLGTTARALPDGVPVRFTYPGRLGL